MISLVTLVLFASPAAGDTPEPRWVTLGSSVTEIVYKLGHGDKVVGTDLTSLYPDETKPVRTLGHFRGLSSEGVLSLRPTLVVAVDGVGPPEAVAAIKRAGVRWVTVPNGHTRTELRAKFTEVGRAIGDEAGSITLLKQVDATLDSIKQRATKPKPKVLFVYARGRGAMNVAGQETGANTILSWAGAVNAVRGFEGYRPLTAEAVVTAKPDYILVTTRGLESLGGVEGLLKAPGVRLTPAGKNRRVIAIDDLELLGFGPRVGSGVSKLAKALSGS